MGRLSKRVVFLLSIDELSPLQIDLAGLFLSILTIYHIRCNLMQTARSRKAPDGDYRGETMTRTKENLEFSFTGESQANRKYLFFAEKADEEGHRQIARLFRAAAEAETVHARNHLQVMQGIKSTRENLLAAIAGENHEFTEMYPSFIRQAKIEAKRRARHSFSMANKVEQIHHGLFRAALSVLESGEIIDEKPFYVCQYCGNTVEAEAAEKCSVCGAPERMFKQVE